MADDTPVHPQSVPHFGRVGHYEILNEIGRGGMGVVYRARDLALERLVALKRPSVGHAANPVHRRRFLREARAAAKLSHANIVPIHEVFEHDGIPWLVMEYVDGTSLRRFLEGGATFSVEELLRNAAELGSALSEAHRHNVLHRDINPSNILVALNGRMLLTDFGLAKFFVPPDRVSSATTHSDPVTEQGGIVGTPGYMAPEQLLGKAVDPRSDLFSLGAVLYEVCTGTQCFITSGRGDLVDAVLHREPKGIARYNNEVPDELVRIVRKLLRKRPEDRYQTATDLLADVRSLHRSIDSQEYAQETANTRISFPRDSVYVIPAAIAVLLAVLGVWWIAQNGSESPGVTLERPRLLTTAPGWEAEPSISPDGEFVAYASDESGNPDIWIVDVQTGGVLALTDHSAADYAPTWFPDGSEVAFVSERSGQASIWKVPRLGGSPILVVPDATYPAISPDGTMIAFARRDSASHLRVTIAPLQRPSETTVLTADDNGFWDHTHPTWSPDGQQICYADFNDLWIVDVTGNPPRRFTTDDARDQEPVWSPDGRFIYFSSMREGTLALWQKPSKGGRPIRLTVGTGPESHPSASNGGARIAYSTFVGSADLVLLDRESQQRTHFRTSSDETAPAIAPDGTSIVFASNRRGRYSLWLQALAWPDPRDAPRQLTDHTADARHPSFSPDGQYVVYTKRIDDQRDIWIVPLGDELPRPLVAHPDTDMQPAWSPDGSKIAFVSDRGGTYQMWVMPVTKGAPAGTPQPMMTGANGVFFPSWSPDGGSLAYIASEDNGTDVWVLGVDGGARRRLTTAAYAAQVRWDGDDAVLVSGSWGNNRAEIRRVIVATGEVLPPELVVDFGSRYALGEFNVSRNTRLLVFVEERMQGDVWVVDIAPDS